MNSPKGKLISLQEVAHQTGASVSLLNYYVNLGLIPIADKNGNKRLFLKSQALGAFQKIQRLKREGYPLRVIRRHLELEGSQ